MTVPLRLPLPIFPTLKDSVLLVSVPTIPKLMIRLDSWSLPLGAGVGRRGARRWRRARRGCRRWGWRRGWRWGWRWRRRCGWRRGWACGSHLEPAADRFQQPVVGKIRDQQVAGRIGCDAGRIAKPVGARRRVAASSVAADLGREAAVLAKHVIGGSVSRTRDHGLDERRVVFEYAVVARVGDIEVACRIGRYALRLAKPGGADAARIAVEASALAERNISRSVRRSRIRHRSGVLRAPGCSSGPRHRDCPSNRPRAPAGRRGCPAPVRARRLRPHRRCRNQD